MKAIVEKNNEAAPEKLMLGKTSQWGHSGIFADTESSRDKMLEADLSLEKKIMSKCLGGSVS